MVAYYIVINRLQKIRVYYPGDTKASSHQHVFGFLKTVKICVAHVSANGWLVRGEPIAKHGFASAYAGITAVFIGYI